MKIKRDCTLDKTIELAKAQKEFEHIIQDLVQNETVQQMKNFRQHYTTSCYDHCKEVAFYSYLICKKLNLDYVAAARAGMLHDLFLYDWRKRLDGRKGLHAFTHPKTACANAKKLFLLSEKEQDIIIKHMWPLTFFFPKYKESYIISFVDKYCAISESFRAYGDRLNHTKLPRYAYVFLSIFLFRIL